MLQQQQQQQQAQPGQSQSLTPTDLAQAVALALKQAMPPPQQQPPQQRQMTEAEIHQRLGTYNPDLTFVQTLFGQAANDEGRLSALQQFVQSVVANATGHARALVEDYLSRYHQHIAEPLEDARYAANEHFFKSVYDGHEGLRPFDGLLKEMLPRFAEAPDYPSDRAARAAYIREKFIPHVKTFQPDFDPTRPPQTQQTQQGRPYHNSPVQQQQQRQQGAGLPSLGGGGSGATVGAQPANGNRPSWDTDGHGF